MQKVKKHLFYLLFTLLMGSINSFAQQAIEHKGNHYVIHVEALETDSETTLFDLLQMCPEFISTDGRNITSDYTLTVDDLSIGIDWEGMLHNVKASELEEIHIYNYSSVANGDDGTCGEINITFRDAAKRDSKIALAGSTYGNGRMFASYAEKGEKTNVRGMLNTELRYGKGYLDSGIGMTSRKGIENACVFLGWQPSERDQLNFKFLQGYQNGKNRFRSKEINYDETLQERLGELSATYERTLNDKGASLYLEGDLDYISTTEDTYKTQTWAPVLNVETSFPLLDERLTATTGWEICYINQRTKNISREQYLFNDFYLQLDYTQGPWLFTIGDRMRLINFWDKNDANTENGEKQWSHHRNNHALHASIGLHAGRHFIQGSIARNFYTLSVSDFYETSEDSNLRIYDSDHDSNHSWQTEMRYTYQAPKTIFSASLLHRWEKDMPDGSEQLTGIRSSVSWFQGPFRLTVGADYYHQHIEESEFSEGGHDNFFHLKLSPTLTIGNGWRLSSLLIYSSRKKYDEEHPWLYASFKVNKDLSRLCNVFADFHDIAGSPKATISDLDGYYKNRAFTIGVTFYPFRQ